jgi:hypothetical protein
MKNLSQEELTHRRLKEILINSNKMSDITFANKVYANLCNLVWYDYINDEVISSSWRGAGGIVADIRNIGDDYMDFYCSGNEGEVDPEIEELFNANGIVVFENLYDSYSNDLNLTQKAALRKKEHPVVVAYNRDKNLNKIL